MNNEDLNYLKEIQKLDENGNKIISSGKIDDKKHACFYQKPSKNVEIDATPAFKSLPFRIKTELYIKRLITKFKTLFKK